VSLTEDRRDQLTSTTHDRVVPDRNVTAPERGSTMTATRPTLGTTMKAVIQDTYGSAEVLAVRDVDRPEVGDGQVLVRVKAAGVNPADWAVMSGLPYIARPIYGWGRPKNAVRGTDVAGLVDAVGAGVTRFAVGDAVFGSGDGSYAEYTVASEDALVLKPDDLTFEQAAAVPMAGLVALQAVRDHGHVSAGHEVLINGASGGVGTFAIQIARSLGAHVTGVCSTRNIELLRSIGADRVIDHTRQDFTRSEQRYDLILDNVGNHSLSDLRRALTPSGTLVPNGGGFDNRWFASGGRVIRAHLSRLVARHNVRPFLVSYNREDLAVLEDLIDAGDVTPVIDRTVPLTEAAGAIGYVGEGHARGKVVIAVGGGQASGPA
jgi:NADPH:quinone reductase-like Zn-dependent oxidoreductase